MIGKGRCCIHSADIDCVPMNQVYAQGLVIQEKQALEASRNSQSSTVDGHANGYNIMEACTKCCGKVGQQSLPEKIGQGFKRMSYEGRVQWCLPGATLCWGRAC